MMRGTTSHVNCQRESTKPDALMSKMAPLHLSLRYDNAASELVYSVLGLVWEQSVQAAELHHAKPVVADVDVSVVNRS